MAKGLKEASTRTLGLVIPDIDNAFSEMANGAQDEAFTHGYTVSNLYHEDDHKFIVKVLSEYLKK